MSADRKKILLFVAFLTCLVLVSAVLFNIDKIVDSFNNNGFDDGDGSNINFDLYSVNIDGEVYMPRRNVRNYLIMGIDEFGDTDQGGIAQADFIVVLSFDSNNDTYTMIQVNRDTMTEVDFYSYSDGSVYTQVAQIALSHADGTYKAISNNKKCESTAKAVSNLLYGVRFDGYVSMTMDAVKAIVDYIGGVPVFMEEDMTEIDARLVQGSTVTFDGELALSFIRARGGLADSSNIARMKRQKVFLDAFVGKLDEINMSDDELAACFNRTSSYMVAKNGVDTFYDIFEKISTHQCSGMMDLPGEAVKGDKYIEFYVDENGLKGIVKDVFFERFE